MIAPVAPFHQYGALRSLDPVSNRIVIGFPLEPLTWVVSMVLPADPVKVPQRCTVIPGPILPELDPQFPEELNQAAECALEQSVPLFPPAPFWLM